MALGASGLTGATVVCPAAEGTGSEQEPVPILRRLTVALTAKERARRLVTATPTPVQVDCYKI